jgi:hypothetical protein
MKTAPVRIGYVYRVGTLADMQMLRVCVASISLPFFSFRSSFHSLWLQTFTNPLLQHFTCRPLENVDGNVAYLQYTKANVHNTPALAFTTEGGAVAAVNGGTTRAPRSKKAADANATKQRLF